MKKLIVTLSILCLSIVSAWGSDLKPRTPGPADKCPVCGMFVAKYPDFASQIQFKDGSYAFFDSAKDMFKYYFALKSYNPRKKLSDISAIHVKDYYTLKYISGYTAYYVVGSDIFGPMGKELVSLGNKADAQGFKKDHKGTAILRFKQVTDVVVKGMD